MTFRAVWNSVFFSQLMLYCYKILCFCMYDYLNAYKLFLFMLTVALWNVFFPIRNSIVYLNFTGYVNVWRMGLWRVVRDPLPEPQTHRSGRVVSDDLGYGPGSGLNFKPVQTSRRAVSDPLPELPSLLQQNTLLPIWNILMWLFWHKWGTKLC